MAPYVAHRPDGRPVIFRIKGEKPSAAETERINSYLTSGPPQTSTEAEPPKEEAPGVLSVLGRTVMRGANEVQAGVDTIMQSAFEGMGDLERAKEWEQAAQEQRAERDTYAAPEGSFLDSNTNKAHAIAGAIGQSAPSMGLGLAGMYAGGAAGSIFGPVGTLVGGAIGGAAGYLPQMLNANAERQIAEHGTVKDWKKAYVSSAIGAGVETITDKIGLRVLGVLADGAKLTGKALTRTTEKAVRDASKNAVDKAMTVVAKKMGTGVALSAVTGATEEVIQANLERWQAELPLMDDAAKAEYLESAIMGGIVESIFGGGAGAVGAHKQIKDTKALQAAKDDHDAEVAKLSAAAKHGEQYEQKRNAPYNEVPPTGPAAPVQPITDPGRMLPDFSAPTREQTALNKEENQLPPGLRDEETDKAEPPAIEEPAKLEAAAASAVAPAATEEQRKTAREARLAETKAHEASGIPFTITNLARKELGDLGYSPDDIKVMTPREAHIIRQQKITQPDLGKARAKFDELVSDISPAARVRPAPTVETTPAPEVGRQGPAVPPFSETEYRDAIAKLRDEGTLSHDKIGKILGVSKPQAEAYFAEMLKRNDAYPAGNYNQYAKITVPHGMATRKQHNVRGKMMPHRSRDYIVKPVRPATGAQPFSVHMNNKRAGKKNNTFTTREDAQAWISKNIPAGMQKDAAIVEDNAGLQYGIHELQYEHLPNREQRLVGEQVVNTYTTEAEAQEAIKGYDPAYSPESNRQQTQRKSAEERTAAAAADYAQEVGPIGAQLTARGEKVLGAGRLELGISPRIVDPNNPDAIIEGSSQHLKREDPQGVRRVVGNLIRLASDLYNPSLTVEQRTKLMEEVLNHELVHALRSLDLLTRQEWDTLFQHAANAKVPGKPYTWLQRATVRTGALDPDSNVNPQDLAEEAIAEMVRHYINDPTAFRNPERGLLRKIADFIKKMMRLSERHDAADLIDTIFEGGIADRAIGHGGLGPRNQDDVFFSLLKTDNFYLDTARFLGNVTREEAPKNDWIKMLSSAGIKPEELNWLGIKQWLEQLPKGELVHKNDIINYVQANGPEVIPVIFAKHDHPDLADAAVMGPQWDIKSQAPYGDKTYAEVAFTTPSIAGEPDYYDSNGHMMVPTTPGGAVKQKLPNVIAFARFRDVVEKVDGEDQKILFIEEIQSDLHQQGSMKGYFSKSFEVKLNEMRDQARDLYNKSRELKGQGIVLHDKLWAIRKKLNDSRTMPAEWEELDAQRRDLMEQVVANAEAADAATKGYHELLETISKGAARQQIPNAPFKSNWEDYVIRRMIRHAVEHGYHGIAWHGSPESVAATEGYGELEVTQDEKGRNKYTAYGETPVGPIVNRYLIKLPRITNGIAQPFGASLNHNLTPTNKQVIAPHEWEPGELGLQDIEDRGRFSDEVRSALPDRYALYDMADSLIMKHKANISNDIYDSEGDAQTAATMVEQLKTARQVAMNRRPENFDAHEVMLSAGLNDTAMKHLLSWHKGGDYYYGMDVALFGEEQKGGLTHDSYRLMFNRDMMQSFEGGDQPFFSMVKERKDQIIADPKFRNWFGQSMVTEDDGTPKVVYHFTSAGEKFGRFNRLSHFGTAQAANDLFRQRHPQMLGTPEMRATMAANARIYPVFINLQRPLRISDTGYKHSAASYAHAASLQGAITYAEEDRIKSLANTGEEEAALELFVQTMEKRGYDGLSYTNNVEGRGSISYTTFREGQVKSIFNQGLWSEDPDIMYSKLEQRGADLLEDNDKFKKWFGGSRVTHENGNPYLVFHGTTEDFDTFDEATMGDSTEHPTAKLGFWFSASPEIATSFAGKVWDASTWPPTASHRQGAHIIPSFLSIKNPYVMSVDDFIRNYRAGTDFSEWRNQLRKKGYDGIHLKRNEARGEQLGGEEYAADAWVSFDAGQIKSALAKEFSLEDDSFKYSMVKPRYSAAAPTGQRVPATPPIDQLTEVHNRMTYDNLSPVIHKLIGWTVPGAARKASAKERVDDTIISLQDRMLSVGRLIDRMKKNGGFITNENDTYLREQLYSSQVDAHLTANDRDYYKKMMDTIQGLGVTQRDFDEAKTIDDKVATILNTYKANHKHALAELYLYAQHARERNALMRERNERIAGERPQQYEAGSGLGDGTAQAVLDWFASKPFAREFNDPTNDNSVRSRMRAIIKNTNDIRVASGLTPDFRTLLHPDGRPVDIYEDYVPIRGRIDEEATFRGEDDVNDFFAKTGKGFNIRGKEDFSALGRESLGRDLIAHAVMQNQETIVRAGKNKVTQSFRKLILDNPAEMSEVAEIMTMPRTKYAYDTKRGIVRQVVDNQVQNDPTVLKGKVDGQQFYIKMKDPRIVKAMGSKSGLGSNSGMPSLLKGLAHVNRFLAATRTSYNPEFMVANMLRDLEAAMVNLSEHGRKNVRRKVMASILPALNGVRKSLRSGTPTGEWAAVHEEFRRHGGHTAVFGIRELSDTIDHINDHLAEDVSGNVSKVKQPIRWIGKFISDYNLVIENGTRLAAYKVLRDQYLELSGDPHDPQNQKRAREMAAFAAKNLTVNFNMGGEAKPVMTAFYMFFNASMQGSLALLNPFIRSRRMKYMWASVLTAGAVQDMMMSMLSPEDEDGEKTYDKIPEHVLEHNMIFMDPFGVSERGYFKLPMPYLMNGIYNWGRAASRAARGKYTAGELMKTGGMTMIDSLNPMGGSNSWLNWVAPSIIDPFVDLSMNEDFTGKPIAPPVSPYDNVSENRSQQYWGNTNPVYVTIADWMSKLTGREGDFIPGYAEASPNQVEYAVDWITGGTGTFLARAGRLMYGAATGELPEMEIEATDIPFLRKAYGSITTRNDLQDYIEGRDQVLRIRKALQDARKEGDDETYRSIMRRYPKEYGVAARINAIENSRKKFSSKIKKIRDSTRLTDEEKEIRVKELKARQDLLVGRGNEVLAAID